MTSLISTLRRHVQRKRWTAYIAVGSVPPDATRFVDDVLRGGLCSTSDDVAQCDLLVLIGAFSAKTTAPLAKIRDRMPAHRVLWFAESSSIELVGAVVIYELPPSPRTLEAALDGLVAVR
jgi:hypothetical protein